MSWCWSERSSKYVVGAPRGPLHGRGAARGFYEQLNREVETESMTATRAYHDGRISRENLWLDGGSAAAQLSAP